MSAEKHDLRKLSLWEHSDHRAVTLTAPGYIYERDKKIKVKVNRNALVDHDELPDNPEQLTDWLLTASSEDNEHFHGAADTVHDVGAAWTKFVWKTAPIAVP